MKKRGEQAVSITTQMNTMDVDLAAVQLLTKKEEMGGVFVCFDRTPAYLEERLDEIGVEKDRVRILTMGSVSAKENSASFVDALDDLSAIKIAIGAALKRLEGKYKKNFVLIDGIPTLSLYNDLKRLGQFLHDLNLELRNKGAYTVVLLGPGGEINQFVMRFCDTNVSLI